MVRSVVFTTNMIARLRFNSQPSLVVASLDKMLHDDYLCLVESGKQQIKEVKRKFNRKIWKQGQLLSESGFVLRIAPPPLSRDRRIKMKKSIKKSMLSIRPVQVYLSVVSPNHNLLQSRLKQKHCEAVHDRSVASSQP